jgi:hypothetical protein
MGKKMTLFNILFRLNCVGWKTTLIMGFGLQINTVYCSNNYNLGRLSSNDTKLKFSIVSLNKRC